MENKGALIYIGGFFILCALSLTRIHGPRVFFIAEGDDEAYFAYARTVAIDHDLSFANEPFSGFQNGSGNLQAARYASGPGLFWSPFLWVGHVMSYLLEDPKDPSVIQGTSLIHWFSVCMGSMLYGLAGFIFLFLFLRRFYSTEASFWSTLLVGFSSPLLYYLFRRPLMAHSTEFFCLVCSAYFISGLKPESRLPRILVAALATGAIFLCRWNDAPYVAAFSIWAVWRLRPTDTALFHITGKQVGLLMSVAVLSSVQLVVWKFLVGRFYPGPALFDLGIVKSSILFTVFPWTFRHFLDLFYGKDWGIFWLSPITATILLAALSNFRGKSFRLEKMILLVPTTIVFWIAANWPSHGGEYGNRYLISAWMFFSFLGADIYDRWSNRRWLRRLFVCGGILCLIYGFAAMSLFKSNADSLTLHVGPTLYGLPSDWINNDFASNAFHQIVKAPFKTAITFGPSLIGYASFSLLRSVGALPAGAAAPLVDYFVKHPAPPFYFWAIFAVFLFSGMALSLGLVQHCGESEG